MIVPEELTSLLIFSISNSLSCFVTFFEVNILYNASALNQFLVSRRQDSSHNMSTPRQTGSYGMSTNRCYRQSTVYDDVSRLGCDAVHCDRSVPTFQRKFLPSLSSR